MQKCYTHTHLAKPWVYVPGGSTGFPSLSNGFSILNIARTQPAVSHMEERAKCCPGLHLWNHRLVLNRTSASLLVNIDIRALIHVSILQEFRFGELLPQEVCAKVQSVCKKSHFYLTNSRTMLCCCSRKRLGSLWSVVPVAQVCLLLRSSSMICIFF